MHGDWYATGGKPTTTCEVIEMGKLLIVGEAAKRCSEETATVDTWQVQAVAKRRPDLFRRAGTGPGH
jgi:hypothetical protein